MRLIPRFVKATIVGGLLFMVPIILMLLVLEQALGMVRKAVTPVASHFPTHTIVGLSATTMIRHMGAGSEELLRGKLS